MFLGLLWLERKRKFHLHWGARINFRLIFVSSRNLHLWKACLLLLLIWKSYLQSHILWIRWNHGSGPGRGTSFEALHELTVPRVCHFKWRLEANLCNTSTLWGQENKAHSQVHILCWPLHLHLQGNLSNGSESFTFNFPLLYTSFIILEGIYLGF